MKAVVITYVDIAILDETEVEYTSQDHLLNLVKEIFTDEPSANFCEVYNKITRECFIELRKTPKGFIKTNILNAHPNVGGRRKGAGNKPKPPHLRKDKNFTLPMRKEMYDSLDALGNKRAAFIREAIKEKWEREKGTLLETPEPTPEPNDKDKRYRKVLSHLPHWIKIYEGYDVRHADLTIVKIDTFMWRVSYGEPSTEEDAPCFTDKNLLNALEHLETWVDTHHKKWVRK